MDRRTRPLEDFPDRRQPACEVRDLGCRRQHGRNPSQKMVFLLKLWPLLPAANTDASRPTQRFVLLTPQSITSTQDSLQESIPLKLVEILPDRIGDQVSHFILRFTRHADARKFRRIRPVGPGAVTLYDDQILSIGHLHPLCRNLSNRRRLDHSLARLVCVRNLLGVFSQK